MRRRITLLLTGLPLVLMLGWAAAGAVLAGGGCHPEGATDTIAGEGSGTTVKLDGCTFAPTITRVPVGAEVRWINDSSSPHDVTGRRFEWGSEQLSTGDSFSRRFAEAGVYPYSCSLHPGMAGVVVVGAPATAADTDDIQQAAALEPVETAPTSDGSTVPLLVACAIGLLGGAAIGALGMKAFARRDDAA
jgi:plastocyanin